MSATSSAAVSKLTTTALSSGRINCVMNSTAASCSKRKRSRMLLLVSIRMASRNGRFDSAVNSRMFCGLLVLDNFEILLGQIGDEPALSVGDGEQKVHARHVQNDAVRIVRFGDGFLGRLLGEGRGEDRQSCNDTRECDCHGRLPSLQL
jgi:hypothetical protein